MQFDRKPFLFRLRSWLATQNLDAILVQKRTNVLYFSGFSGTAGDLAISENDLWLLTDFRYVEQATKTAPDFSVRRSLGRLVEDAVHLLWEQGCRHIGFEGDFLSVDGYRRLRSMVESDDNLVSVKLDVLRAVKTEAEIHCIRKAANIVDQAFAELADEVHIGCSEIELAARLEYFMRKLGSERTAFETIVASGPRSALPHGLASDRRIVAGDLIVFDFGAVYGGYHSDMTRTWCAGNPDAESRRMYDAVMKAQAAGLKMLRAGVKARDVDAEARRVLSEFGLAEYFGHGLGHSVGLEIHEEPRLSLLAGEAVLESGMVLTVEPGVYVPGLGGVRVEDLVVVTPTGCEILSQTPKDLRMVGP